MAPFLPDYLIFQDFEVARDYYGLEIMLVEILNNFFMELTLRLVDNGGPDFTG